jgi:hypothetical protein
MPRGVRRFFASLCASVMLAGVAASPAAAANNNQQDGLVNVAIIGDCTVVSCNQTNVGVGVAANVAANVCGVKVNVAVLAIQQVDRGAQQTYSCSNAGQTSTVEVKNNNN